MCILWILLTCDYIVGFPAISDRIRKNMPAVDSKTVAVARSVLTTPLARRKPPPREYVTGTSPAAGHGNTEHSNKPKQLNKTQSITKLFGTQIDKSN